MIFFSDKVEKFIPPKKGRSHILRIIRELVAFEPRHNSGTDVDQALTYMNNALKKRTITFLLSDFRSKPYHTALQIAARKHDLVGLQIYDKYDKDLPALGLIQVMDSETRRLQWLDTNDKGVRNRYAQAFEDHKRYCTQSFRKSGATLMQMRTDDDYVKVLQGFFKGR